jgi:hypothetical protein
MIVWNVVIVNIFTNKVKFSYWQTYNFPRIHKLFYIIYRRLQALFPSPLILAKWSRYTHTKALPISLCSFIKPLVWNLHPLLPHYFVKKMPHEQYLFRNFIGSIYWHLCFPFFHFSVSWSSEMQFGVIYLKTWGGTQPYVASSTLEICSCFFVFGRTHMAPNSLTLHKPVSVVACV